jgi:hypothetical protein
VNKGTVRLPRPALVVACIALLVSLSGTAIAAAPVAKRALFANNAGKLQGRTATQIAELPGPASTAAGLVTIKTASWSLGPGAQSDFVVACDSGRKAVGGGWDDPSGWGAAWDDRPAQDGSAWRIYIGVSASAPGTQTGGLYAVCLG